MSKYSVYRKDEPERANVTYPIPITCPYCDHPYNVIIDTDRKTLYLPYRLGGVPLGGGEVQEGRGTPSIEHITTSRLSPTREQVEKLRAEGLSFREIGRRFNLSDGAIRRRLPGPTVPRTGGRQSSLIPQLPLIRRLAKKGVSYSEIGRACGRSIQTVYQFMKIQGIEKEDAVGGSRPSPKNWQRDVVRHVERGALHRDETQDESSCREEGGTITIS